MTPDLERIEALAKAATEGNLKLNRYNHGGGRLYADDDLIADFYDESNREFYATCSPQTILALVARVRELEAASKSLTEERRKEICGMQDLLDAQAGDIRTLQARVREMSALEDKTK